MQVVPYGLRRFKHIFGKDGVAFGGVVDEDVGDRADEFAVLHDGCTAHALYDTARDGEQIGVGDLHNHTARTGGITVTDLGNLNIVPFRFCTRYRSVDLGIARAHILFEHDG